MDCRNLNQSSQKDNYPLPSLEKVLQIVNDIPVKLDLKPFHQRKQPVNPLIEPLIMKEVEKLLKEKVIFPIWHSIWVANLVLVHKKNGEIGLCMNFKNLNQLSQKDNYPLPSLDEVLQIVNGSKYCPSWMAILVIIKWWFRKRIEWILHSLSSGLPSYTGTCLLDY